MSILAWILLGLAAGWLAGQFVRGGGYGLIGRAPFADLFGKPQANRNVLELHFVVALLVSALVAWLLGKLTGLMFGETWSTVRTSAVGDAGNR